MGTGADSQTQPPLPKKKGTPPEGELVDRITSINAFKIKL